MATLYVIRLTNKQSGCVYYYGSHPGEVRLHVADARKFSTPADAMCFIDSLNSDPDGPKVDRAEWDVEAVRIDQSENPRCS